MANIINNGQGSTDWNKLGEMFGTLLNGGDQLTPALKRAQLQGFNIENAAKGRELNYGQTLADRIRQGTYNGNDFAADALLAGIKAPDAYGYGLGEMSTRYGAGSEQADRFRGAVGKPYNDTASAFGIQQQNALAMNNADNAAAMDRERMKPVEAMVPNPNAVGPFVPGAQPRIPGFVTQGDAVASGAQPIIKNGQSLTVNPDGSVSFSQGGVSGDKPTEISRKADLIGSAMIPGLAGLMGAYDGGQSLSTPAAAVTSLLPNNPLVTTLAQGAGAINPQDQQLNSNMESMLTYLYQLTGAARTPSEDARARAAMPLPTDTPETRRIKQNTLAEIALGIASQAKDPRVKEGLVQAIQGMYTPVAGPDAGVPRGPAAAPAPTPSGPVRVNSPAEALALPPGTQFVTPDGRVKVRP